MKRPGNGTAGSGWWMAPAAAETFGRVSGALAYPGRLHLLAALVAGERNVTTLTHLTGYTQPRVSKHLAALRRLRIVQRRVQGTERFYQLAADDPAAQAARALLVVLSRHAADPGQG